MDRDPADGAVAKEIAMKIERSAIAAVALLLGAALTAPVLADDAPKPGAPHRGEEREQSRHPARRPAV
jgi:hypothetical protein